MTAVRLHTWGRFLLPDKNVKTALKRSFEERHPYTDAKETWKSAAESDSLFPEGLKSTACQLEQSPQQAFFFKLNLPTPEILIRKNPLYHLGSLSSFNSRQLRRAWETCLELARGKWSYYTLFWASIVPFPIYLDRSDHKGSSDITQSISKQGKEDRHSVKYIYHAKYRVPFLSNPGQGYIRLTKFCLLYFKIKTDWHSRKTNPSLPPVYYRTQERDRLFSYCPLPHPLGCRGGKKQYIFWSPIYHSNFHSHKLLLRL